MSENAIPAAKVVRSCQCLLGWTGTAGSGSTLAMADNPASVCDRTTRKSFAQGHDARMSSRLATEMASGETSADVAVELIRRAGGTELLVEKTLRSAQLRMKNKQAAPADESDDDEMLAAGAENLASDEGISLDDARERMGLEPLGDVDLNDVPGLGEGDEGPDPMADGEPELPEIGVDWTVRHGKRSYKAKVIEAHTGERVASHKLGQGRDCCHDLATGEIVDLSGDDEEVPF